MGKRRKHKPFLVGNQPHYLVIHPSDPAFKTPLGLVERVTVFRPKQSLPWLCQQKGPFYAGARRGPIW